MIGKKREDGSVYGRFAGLAPCTGLGLFVSICSNLRYRDVTEASGSLTPRPLPASVYRNTIFLISPMQLTPPLKLATVMIISLDSPVFELLKFHRKPSDTQISDFNRTYIGSLHQQHIAGDSASWVFRYWARTLAMKRKTCLTFLLGSQCLTLTRKSGLGAEFAATGIRRALSVASAYLFLPVPGSRLRHSALLHSKLSSASIDPAREAPVSLSESGQRIPRGYSYPERIDRRFPSFIPNKPAAAWPTLALYPLWSVWRPRRHSRAMF